MTPRCTDPLPSRFASAPPPRPRASGAARGPCGGTPAKCAAATPAGTTPARSPPPRSGMSGMSPGRPNRRRRSSRAGVRLIRSLTALVPAIAAGRRSRWRRHPRSRESIGMAGGGCPDGRNAAAFTPCRPCYGRWRNCRWGRNDLGPKSGEKRSPRVRGSDVGYANCRFPHAAFPLGRCPIFSYSVPGPGVGRIRRFLTQRSRGEMDGPDGIYPGGD